MKIKTQENPNIFDKLGADVQSFFNDLETNNSELLTSKIENIKNEINVLIKISLIRNLQKEENPRVISSDNKNIQIEIKTQDDAFLNSQNIEDIERKLISNATNGIIQTTIDDLQKILDHKITEERYRNEILSNNNYSDMLSLLSVRFIKISNQILNFENLDKDFECNRIGLLLYILGIDNHKLKVYGNDTEAYIYDENLDKTFICGNTKNYKTYISEGETDLYDIGELSLQEIEKEFISINFQSSKQRESEIKNLLSPAPKQYNLIKEIPAENIEEQIEEDPIIEEPILEEKKVKIRQKRTKIKAPIVEENNFLDDENINSDKGEEQITQIETNRIHGLDKILKSEKNARPWQKETWINIKNMISKGINRGSIILPCSSGKTRIVSELLKMNNSTKLYLLPKNVIGISVTEDLAKWGVPKEKIIDCTNGQEDVKLRTLDISSIQDHVIVANYRGLLNLRKNQKTSFDKLISRVGMVLSDEAHRSLGTETREAIDECMAFESLITKAEDKLHLLFTSTPKLLFKEISNYYPYTIISKTMEDIYLESKKYDIESPLVLPKFRRMGPVYLTLDKLVNYKGSDINEDFFTRYANKVRVFVDRDGNPLEVKMFKEYMKLKKENGGYAPALGVCNTIEQAQRFTDYFQKQGIPARRCTGSNKIFQTDLEYSELKEFVDRGGVVFTADAITEGINIPSLRIIMECAYTGSPARVVQSIGRTTRAISDEELEYLKKLNPEIDESNLQKTHSNTTCLGPSMRWGDYEPIEKKQTCVRNKGGSFGNQKKKIQLKTFYDFVLDSGEMGYETMNKEGDLYTGEDKMSYGDSDFHGKFKSPNMWLLLRNDIGKYSNDPLDRNTEKSIIEKCKQGDEEAKEILIKSNVRFVLYKAKKRYYYYKKIYPQMQSTITDFISAGFEGLIISISKIDKFKTELDCSFISFAQAYIQNGFRDLFHKEENCISKVSGIYIPSITTKKYLTDEKEIEENNEKIISAIENDFPNRNEILEEGFIDKISLRKKYSTKKTADGKTSLYDLMDTEIVDDLDNEISKDKADDEMTKESLQKEINRMFRTLTEREEAILSLFFGIRKEEFTLEEIGEKYGLTPERTRQIKEKALRRCRHTSRSKILRGYLGDPDVDSIPDLSGIRDTKQSIGQGEIGSMSDFIKSEIILRTKSPILAMGIIPFMNVHELSEEVRSDVIKLNITWVAELRNQKLFTIPGSSLAVVENALAEHDLFLSDDRIRKKIAGLFFQDLVD